MRSLLVRCFNIFPNKIRNLTSVRDAWGKQQELILSHTELTRNHLTPELQLHLITPKCSLWNSQGDSGPFEDPFWAFYWPGGQALSRYILDNPERFRGRRILDVGSGCGASAIACKMVGALSVLANDIDKVALEAVKLNAERNCVQVENCSENMIGSKGTWDIVLFGDMFYDDQFAEWVCTWIQTLSSDVYIGDPGRLPFSTSSIKDLFTLVAEYDLPENCLKENYGQSTGYVWHYKGHCTS